MLTPTEEKYFEWHIPHRVNLLITFRHRYASPASRDSLDSEQYRDLFRCAKDMSLLMVRFFCEEMGVYLSQKTNDIEESQEWSNSYRPKLKIKPLRKVTLKADPRYADLCEVLRAANRTVAHIELADVDHSFRYEPDNQRIFSVIDWIEQLVESNIYQAAVQDYRAAMSLPQNAM